MGVCAGVVEEFWTQRSCTPVGHLVLFLRLEVDVSLQQVSQACAGVAQRSRGVECVEQTDQVESKIALKPDDVHERAMEDFENVGVGKDFVQTLELPSPGLQSVHYPILVACADLHERDHANVRAIVVVLQVNCQFFRLLQLSQHGVDGLGGVDKSGGGLLKGRILHWLRMLVDGFWEFVGLDLGLVRVRVLVAALGVLEGLQARLQRDPRVRLRDQQRAEGARLVVGRHVVEGELRLRQVFPRGDVGARLGGGLQAVSQSRRVVCFGYGTDRVRAGTQALDDPRVLVQTRVGLLKQAVDDINDRPPIAVYSFDVG